MKNPIIPIGNKIKGLGEIVGVWCGGGERYYFLVDKNKVVSFMPADAIEKLYEKPKE